MARLDGPRDYCGALPPWSDTASCLKSPGHVGPHRSADRRTWCGDCGRELDSHGSHQGTLCRTP